MRLIQIIILALLILLNSNVAFAQTNNDQNKALKEVDRIQQRNQNLIKYLGLEYKRKEREKEQSKTPIPSVESKEIKGGPCFEVKTIELKNATIITKKNKDIILKKYLGKCLGLGEINQVMRDITNHYFAEGYVTTRVAIPEQDLKDGSLELLVIEGRIEDFKLNNNSFKDKTQIKFLFPFLQGKILNLRDIEQGLEQLNRLSSSKATMEIEPGSKDGFSKIVIRNEINGSNRAGIGLNNSGQETTGKDKATVSLERDNLLGMGEFFNFSYNKDTSNHNYQLGSEIISTMLSIPFGYWTLSGNFSRSEYTTTLNVPNQTFRSNGKTESGGFSLAKIINRTENGKTGVEIGLQNKNITTFNQGEEAPTQTRALSIAKAGLNHTQRAFNSIIYGTVAYERGLNWFGAREDKINLGFLDPHAQFNKLTFDGSFYKPFTIKNQNFAGRIYASGQYSNNSLFPSEQISIGDRYTVRGFQKESILGNAGGYVRNELMWDMPQFSKNKYINKLIGTFQPYTGLDFGGTRNRGGKSNGDQSGLGYISGAGFGIRNNADLINFDIAYFKALKTPSYFKEDGAAYFSISLNFKF